MPERRPLRAGLRLVGNMLAAFLIGEGVMVTLSPGRQAVLWSPCWSPPPWRAALRFFAARPSLTRAAVLAEVAAGLLLASRTNDRPRDR